MNELIERLRNFEGSDALGNGDFSLLREAAAQAVEIEALRAEVERLKVVAHGFVDEIALKDRRAERLAEALRGMVDNACAACDVLPNGTHRIDATEQEWASHVAATDKAIAALRPISVQEEGK